MADYVYPRFATSFPGLFPFKWEGKRPLFPPLPISKGKALGTRLQGSVEYQWSAEWGVRSALKVETLDVYIIWSFFGMKSC